MKLAIFTETWSRYAYLVYSDSYARIFNAGLAIGPDSLLDSNRRAWFYQRWPWFGVVFALSLY